MPQFTVVVPAYDPAAGLLERALESVLAQTLTDLEVIVVDDGSRVDVGWVAEHPDPRVRYVRQANAGVSVARNTGVGLARGAWVAFLDQDDEWLPEKLARQATALAEDPEAAFYYTAFVWELPSGPLPSSPAAVTYRSLLADGHVCLSSVVVARVRYQRVGGHDPLLRNMQDFDLFLKLCLDGAAPAGLDEPLVRYHVHGGNVSADYATSFAERTSILDRHAHRAARLEDKATLAAIARGRRRTRELFAHQALDATRAQWARRRLGPTLRHGAMSARLDPLVLARALGATARRRLGPGAAADG